jgi:hypothetical protein
VADEVYRIKVVCDHGHRQEMLLHGVTETWIGVYCGLLDGTSQLYVHPPRADLKSRIGRCSYVEHAPQPQDGGGAMERVCEAFIHVTYERVDGPSPDT